MNKAAKKELNKVPLYKRTCTWLVGTGFRCAGVKRLCSNCNYYFHPSTGMMQNWEYNKMLSYRRETTLQGALVLH